MSMNSLMTLLYLGLDGSILTLCSKAVFRSRDEGKLPTFFIFLILFALCVIPNVNLVVGTEMTTSFLSEGLEILPANSIVGVLFLVFAVLIVHSLFFSEKSNSTILCGTLAAFSIFLLVKCISTILFAVCGAEDILLLLGSRIVSLCFIALLWFTPLFGLIETHVQRSDFFDLIVFSNITVLVVVTLWALSFDVNRIITHFLVVSVLVLAVLLLDGILLYLHQRKVQEHRRIHMIEQYVPIVEELIPQVRARQHEFNNRMLAIEAAVASANTIEEARKEIEGLIGGIGISVNDQQLLSCDSKIIAGMLFGKIKQAESFGIDIELSLHGLFKKTLTPEIEWIEAIGILLDNAIEASPKGSTIFLSARKQGDLLELTVSNPSSPLSNSEFMALFEKGVTTKVSSDGHGFGLYNIMRLTERYHGKILTRNEHIADENYVVFGILMP